MFPYSSPRDVYEHYQARVDAAVRRANPPERGMDLDFGDYNLQRYTTSRQPRIAPRPPSPPHGMWSMLRRWIRRVEPLKDERGAA